MKYLLSICFVVSHSMVAAQLKMLGLGYVQVDYTTKAALEEGNNSKIIDVDGSDFIVLNPYLSGSSLDEPKMGKLINNSGTDRFNVFKDDIIDGYDIVLISYCKIEDLKLTHAKTIFKNDTLIYFYSDISTDLDNILEYKYGKPKLYSKTDTIICTRLISGVKIPHETYLYHQTWTVGNCSAEIFLSKDYDDDCKEELLSSFTMKDDKRYKEYETLKAEKKNAAELDKLKKY